MAAPLEQERGATRVPRVVRLVEVRGPQAPREMAKQALMKEGQAEHQVAVRELERVEPAVAQWEVPLGAHPAAEVRVRAVRRGTARQVNVPALADRPARVG